MGKTVQGLLMGNHNETAALLKTRYSAENIKRQVKSYLETGFNTVWEYTDLL